MRIACLAIAAALGTSAWGQPQRLTPKIPTQLDATVGDKVFPEYQARFGSFSSREHCATVRNGLWVHPENEPTGECIRYYAAGARTGASREMVLFFSGDDLGRDRILSSPTNYARLTPNRMQADVERARVKLGTAFAWVARPGVRGSSGDQLLKTRLREMRLMNDAVSSLKIIYGVTTFHAYGQSGGGAVLAALLNMRSDIGCAVLASANLDVDQWLAEQPGDRRGGATDWYNPRAHINANTLRARIVILSDPRDKAVSFGSQRNYARAIEKAGGHSVHAVAGATGPLHHSLVAEALPALHSCIKGLPLQTIKVRTERADLRSLVPPEAD